LELALTVLNTSPQTDVVFLTAYNQYAVEAFEINALDYLMKPLVKDRFRKTIERLKYRYPEKVVCHKPEVRCYGSFAVFLDGKSLVFRNSKAREILAFLISRAGEAISWQFISEAVWPENELDKVHINFNTTMYRLRRILSEAGIADILEMDGYFYRVNMDKISCDAYFNGRFHNSEHCFEKDGYLWAIE
jgi:two-component SAPR family response regulator